MDKQFQTYSLDDDTVICRDCDAIMNYEDQDAHDCPARFEDEPDSRAVWMADFYEDDLRR